jgi:hypothetical protein
MNIRGTYTVINEIERPLDLGFQLIVGTMGWMSYFQDARTRRSLCLEEKCVPIRNELCGFNAKPRETLIPDLSRKEFMNLR